MLTLVKFYADWCQPCKAMAPVVEQLKNKVEFILAEVNIEDNPGLRQENHVKSIPTLILYDNGKEIGRHVGQASVTELEDWVRVSRGLQPEVLPEQSAGSNDTGVTVRDGSSEPQNLEEGSGEDRNNEGN